MKKLFYNGIFKTMVTEEDNFKGCLVENGIIKEIYKKELPTGDFQKIDLANSYIYPAFTDTHTHSFEGGLYSKGADCSAVKSINELLDLLGDSKPISDMIFAWNFDENATTEKRFPSIDELDHIFPETPLLLRRVDGHSCVINTKAKKMISWKYSLPEDFTGLLKGDLNDNAAHWFHKNLNPEAIISCYQAAEKIAVLNGHTRIHTMIGDAKQDILHYDVLKATLKSFNIDYLLYPQCFSIEKALERKSSRIGGCILADGSFGSHTAALFSAYEDQKKCFGTPYQTQQFWDDFVLKAHLNDLQIGVHCIGDFAITQLINAIEKAQKVKQKDLRHEIIHCELVSDEMIKRMRDNNISAVMQPMFDALWGGKNSFYHKVLGLDRAMSCNRLKSIKKSGVLITGGSDWYITELNALKGIEAAMKIHNPEERLNSYEAIELYTKNAAKLSHDENHFGTLEIGKVADFVCLNHELSITTDFNNTKINNVFIKGDDAFFSKIKSN